MTKHVLVVDDRELATVLASLRHFQQSFRPTSCAKDGFEHFEECEPLDEFDIDHLCQRLNTQDWHLGVYLDEDTGACDAYVGENEEDCQQALIQVARDQATEEDDDAGGEDHWSSPNGCHEDCPACAAGWYDKLESGDHAEAWKAFNDGFLASDAFSHQHAKVFHLGEVFAHA